jgi:hypothetical protein
LQIGAFYSNSYISDERRSTAVAQQPERLPPDKVEILPPTSGDQSFGHVFYSSGRGTAKIIRLGPLGAITTMLAIGLMLAFGLLFMSGMLLLLFATLVIRGTGAYLANRLRGFRRFR